MPAALGTWIVAWWGGGRLVSAVCGCAASSAVVTALHAGALQAGPVAELVAREAAVHVDAVVPADPRRVLTSSPGGRDLMVARVRRAGDLEGPYPPAAHARRPEQRPGTGWRATCGPGSAGRLCGACLLEALSPREDESHGSTEELPGRPATPCTRLARPALRSATCLLR